MYSVSFLERTLIVRPKVWAFFTSKIVVQNLDGCLLLTQVSRQLIVRSIGLLGILGRGDEKVVHVER